MLREHHGYTGVPILTHYTMHSVLAKQQKRSSNFKWLRELLMDFSFYFPLQF